MTRTTIPIAVARTAVPNAADGDNAELQFSAPPPLALYIHVPWCVRKCPYCDFNSHEAKTVIPEDEYVAALIADLESALPQIWGRIVSSIFIGGGTPSLFSPEAYDTLLAAVRARVNLQADAEITLEANPGTVEAAKFAGFRNAGINRVSLGIQSFDDAKLRSLGRIHSADEARRAIDLALQHFDRVNLDLMYALPEQKLKQAEADIKEAISRGTEHLSAYHLTLEPNTPFHHSPPPLPDDDLSADMQLMVEEFFAAAGYEHYETSAFAKRGGRCRHNLNYWNFGDYLGIGAGAHGKLSFPDRIVRQTRIRNPDLYLDRFANAMAAYDEEPVDDEALPFEFMLNAMRLVEGVPLRRFEERTGLSLAAIEAPLAVAESRGLIERDAFQVRPTARGLLFLNDLQGLFLPSANR